jgi:hypothetical protein
MGLVLVAAAQQPRGATPLYRRCVTVLRTGHSQDIALRVVPFDSTCHNALFWPPSNITGASGTADSMGGPGEVKVDGFAARRTEAGTSERTRSTLDDGDGTLTLSSFSPNL